MTVLEDKDLRSIQQARTLAEKAAAAGSVLKTYSQQQVDKIVGAMAEAARTNAEHLASMAVQETGRGKLEDKTTKNLFAAVEVYNHIKDLKTCGVIGEDKEKRIIEIGVPFGVIAVIVPTTNPTSTTIFKILSAIKGRNTVVISPHPQAVRCTTETALLMREAAVAAGAPEDCINCMDEVTLEGTNELMRHKQTKLILATGGMGLVRAAYSSGKPAYGVGPGNVPAFVERTAVVPKAVRDILAGKTFDNGMLCSSEQALICDKPILSQVLDELRKNHAYLLKDDEQAKLERVVQLPNKGLNPAIVGRDATEIAQMAGILVPEGTVCLVGRPEGVGLDHPLSLEKLSPILALYVVDGWQAGCEKCMEVLKFGGMGHTMTIHSRDQRVILEFGLQKPAHRIGVNTPATQGSVGLTTGLSPSMTLGCGGPGGNITSDNITARHLINVRRLAFELRSLDGRVPDAADARESEAAATPSLPVVKARPLAGGSGTDVEGVRRLVRSVVEDYVGRQQEVTSVSGPSLAEEEPDSSVSVSPENSVQSAVDFVCEEDVRRALEERSKIIVSSRTIITPAASDMGQGKDVFIWE